MRKVSLAVSPMVFFSALLLSNIYASNDSMVVPYSAAYTMNPYVNSGSENSYSVKRTFSSYFPLTIDDVFGSTVQSNIESACNDLPLRFECDLERKKLISRHKGCNFFVVIPDFTDSEDFLKGAIEESIHEMHDRETGFKDFVDSITSAASVRENESKNMDKNGREGLIILLARELRYTFFLDRKSRDKLTAMVIKTKLDGYEFNTENLADLYIAYNIVSKFKSELKFIKAPKDMKKDMLLLETDTFYKYCTPLYKFVREIIYTIQEKLKRVENIPSHDIVIKLRVNNIWRDVIVNSDEKRSTLSTITKIMRNVTPVGAATSPTSVIETTKTFDEEEQHMTTSGSQKQYQYFFRYACVTICVLGVFIFGFIC